MVARGEVWWVDFGVPLGSEPGKRRPAVVVSDDRFNRSRLNTVTAVALTSNVRLGASPGNVSLPRGAAGLDRPSVVNVTQMATLDRQRLISRSGTLTRADVARVDDGLRLALRL
ncbi:MAG: type II toxin-antitoxin system PemK/MazF family toxin [Candidatus Dormiibacterota bacterium]